MKYCFVFVCQQGELEIKSLLLAASLKLRLRCEHELVAALPQPEAHWGKPAAATLNLLESLGARLVKITNPIGTDYPIGNKLACLGIETDAEKIVFLDSDMLLLREFHHQPRFGRPVNVKAADFATYGAGIARWVSAYASCGLSVPPSRMTATVSGELMPPYFNAGFVAALRSAELGRAWLECARAIEADASVQEKRPWLDQIALPVALAKLGLTADCLDERYNYPANMKPLNPGDLPYFCHYHSPDVLRREPLANALVLELADQYAGLRAALEANPAWRPLLQPYALTSRAGWARSLRGHLPNNPAGQMRKAVRNTPELVITGIPRSGTSYLCKLVHAVEDCVVINEPAEIFAALAQQPIPWGVAIHYRELRRDVLDGKPVTNKLHRGEFIEDTARVDTIEHYAPKVSRPDFLLGTKNTLAYMARLPQLKRAMPDAAIVACVRHPLDTIASWKTTFAHLASADMESQALGNSRDPYLSGLQRDRLQEISAAPTAALKRALLWRHLGEMVLDLRDRIVLIHYEEMVANPVRTLNRVLDAVSGSPPLRLATEIGASQPRRKREVLDAEDLEAIRGICAQTAAALGYDIY